MEIAETNVTTGVFVQREMTVEEIAKDAEHIAKIAVQEAGIKKIADKAETDKIAAQAKLAALGLTADDLKALGL